MIRRNSVKIFPTGKICIDKCKNDESDPVPFESSDPNITIYLRRIIK